MTGQHAKADIERNWAALISFHRPPAVKSTWKLVFSCETSNQWTLRSDGSCKGQPCFTLHWLWCGDRGITFLCKTSTEPDWDQINKAQLVLFSYSKCNYPLLYLLRSACRRVSLWMRGMNSKRNVVVSFKSRVYELSRNPESLYLYAQNIYTVSQRSFRHEISHNFLNAFYNIIAENDNLFKNVR